MKPCILLLSGGIDSVTTGAILRSRGFDLFCMSFSYGQRHVVELECAQKVARHLGAHEHRIINIDLAQFGGSALTADIEVPKDRELDDAIPITYVPARNTIFLSYALAWSEVLGANDLAIGVTAVDYSGYPDCRPEFVQAYAKLANLATKRGVEGEQLVIHTPLIDLSKRQIIQAGLDLGLDYSLTTSCYDPAPNGKPCGHCDSCQIRNSAFAELGLIDPLLQV